MKRISSGIIFLVLILAFISALSSTIVFASMAQQEKSVSNESNPTKTIIDKNYNEKKRQSLSSQWSNLMSERNIFSKKMRI